MPSILEQLAGTALRRAVDVCYHVTGSRLDLVNDKDAHTITFDAHIRNVILAACIHGSRNVCGPLCQNDNT